MSIGPGSPWATFAWVAISFLENPIPEVGAREVLGALSLCREVDGSDEAIKIVVLTGYALERYHPELSPPFSWPRNITTVLLSQVDDDKKVQGWLDKVAGVLEIEAWQLAPIFGGAASQQVPTDSEQYQRHISLAIMSPVNAEFWREAAQPGSGYTMVHPFAARLNQLLGS